MLAARGGWANVVYGNLEYLDDEDARWFAKVQKLYMPLQALGRTKSFGGVPGEIEPYGFGSVDVTGAVYTVVNPTQSIRDIELPLLSRVQTPLAHSAVLFRDSGFVPVVRGNRVTLGPGQMAAIGFQRYADAQFSLGVEPDVRIPEHIAPLDVSFVAHERNSIAASLISPLRGDLRLVFRQRNQMGEIQRSVPNLEGDDLPGSLRRSPPFDKVFVIQAEQNGKSVPVDLEYNQRLFSGLSWAVGEIRGKALTPGQPLTILFSTSESQTMQLEGRVYNVEY